MLPTLSGLLTVLGIGVVLAMGLSSLYLVICVMRNSSSHFSEDWPWWEGIPDYEDDTTEVDSKG